MSTNYSGRESGASSTAGSADPKLDQLLSRLHKLSSEGSVAPQAAAPVSPVRASLLAESPVRSSAAPTKVEAAAHPADPFAKPLLFTATGNREEPFIPLEPRTLAETGLSESLIEEIILRYLLAKSEAPGRTIADQLKLPFGLIEPILNRLKGEQLTGYRGSNSMNDYVHTITDAGREKARRFNLKTTYYGAAPVPIDQYINAVKHQSVETQRATVADLKRAFQDLLVAPDMLAKLGPAVNSGRGMFLFGFPGNGKTSIAERVTAAFGKHIWIPRALVIDGEIMRLFDPMSHVPEQPKKGNELLDTSHVDRRWIRIRRPTIIAGGELTMSMLEVTRNAESGISESPLQLKSNCGVLLIDDFGRQRMSVDELLNRWIVPLEKRYDYLNMVSGKKTQVPFDQLVIFSTNLEPKDLVDEAFLRRIPYKIEVPNPSEAAFRKLFEIMAKNLSIPYRQDAVDYVIQKHYKEVGRPFRNCQPRDLLLQIRNFCYYHSIEPDMRPEYFDYAADNYFAVM